MKSLNMSMRKRILLRDNRDLTPLEFATLKELRTRIVMLVESRNDYVSSHDLDPAFCFPDAGWKEDREFFDAYRHVVNGDYESFNRLRFWVQAFTGYQIMTLTPASGLCSVNPIPIDFDNWIVAHRPEPDSCLDLYQTLVAKLPSNVLYRPPAVMGEIGWDVGGVIFNYDTYSCQERIALLHEIGEIERLRSLPAPRILEIGGGYGALALAFRKIIPTVQYTNCDLPESLLFSALYLSTTIGLGPKTRLLPNYMFHTLIESSEAFDLVINAWSMAEMSSPQVKVYAEGISQLIRNNGIFFEQNHDDTHSSGWPRIAPIIEPHFRNNYKLSSRIVSDDRFHGRQPNIWSNRPFMAAA